MTYWESSIREESCKVRMELLRRGWPRAYDTDMGCRVGGEIGGGKRSDPLCDDIIVVVHIAEDWERPRAATGRWRHRSGTLASDEVRERDDRLCGAMRDFEDSHRGILDT
jgi:hypothetical protein